MKALLIDHDDSFTFNLQHWLSPICKSIEVINHRELGPAQSQKHDLVVLSPGPHHPQHYPHVVNYIQNLSAETAVYGVCLGLQMLVYSSGGKIKTYSPPLHGKKSKLNILNEKYNELQLSAVARYHSLMCDEVNPELFELLAVANDNIPMWLRHTQKKWMGVQFHPESFLTEKAETHLKFLNEWLRS